MRKNRRDPNKTDREKKMKNRNSPRQSMNAPCHHVYVEKQLWYPCWVQMSCANLLGEELVKQVPKTCDGD